ncbi:MULTISPECIES: hypothetical protein [unclassified Moorena]|uniref:hypothetical protein n=1 Tax=unclassified Moorena TaxID=2683338 RepID=UPI001401288E|nr:MULTISPECIES: hypothetical protein [unclassified Moorena]NEO15301.1 hypothetical protein [Moorena sp. SIO3E8]NEQ01703.1 hypothetical protein [Moorena sp. SIO3F7]
MLSSFYQELLSDTPPPLSESPLGPKPTNLEERKKAAHQISQLMTRSRPFCFLRLGDMDLAYLLAFQEGRLNQVEFGEGIPSGTLPQGNPGLGPKYARRFQEGFEKGDYVDFHERLYPMEQWIPLWKHNRSPNLYRNSNRETSYILLTWMEYEFKAYCQNRRVGIAGAEASLLKNLSSDREWQIAAQPFWPNSASIFFHQVREDGRQLDANLDLIKQDLKEFIEANELDTLFLSLGGGAKILCYELSREHNICAFDFGSMIRALTYSACDGNRAARSTHSPFLFRVPFKAIMSSIELTYGNLTIEEKLAKAHAQLLLEVQNKEKGWTHTAFEYDFSKENKSYFQDSFRDYVRQYRKLGTLSKQCRTERINFLHFCGKNKLTREGQVFYFIFLAKNLLRKKLEDCVTIATTLSSLNFLRKLS